MLSGIDFKRHANNSTIMVSYKRKRIKFVIVIFWLNNSKWIQWKAWLHCHAMHGEASFIVPLTLTLHSTIVATMKHMPECRSNSRFYSIRQNG